MLKAGEELIYLEYLDHGCSPEEIDEIKRKPLVLWCVGKIINPSDSHNPYLVVVSSGTRFRHQDTTNFEYILKSTIIKKEVIKIIEE